jgi:hypothetical protein
MNAALGIPPLLSARISLLRPVSPLTAAGRVHKNLAAAAATAASSTRSKHAKLRDWTKDEPVDSDAKK